VTGDFRLIAKRSATANFVSAHMVYFCGANGLP